MLASHRGGPGSILGRDISVPGSLVYDGDDLGQVSSTSNSGPACWKAGPSSILGSAPQGGLSIELTRVAACHQTFKFLVLQYSTLKI